MRLDAYYYRFEPTGIAEIDMVLSAVACAGKASHHTESWTEEYGELYEHTHGQTPSEWIQNAANAAAAEILRLRSLIPTCERGPKACDAEIQDLKNRLWAAETALKLVPVEINLRLEKLAESADREARICKKLLADTRKQIHRGGVIIAEQMAREIRAAQHKRSEPKGDK